MADLEKVLIQSDSIHSVCHVARPCFINEALATQNLSRGFLSTVVEELRILYFIPSRWLPSHSIVFPGWRIH